MDRKLVHNMKRKAGFILLLLLVSLLTFAQKTALKTNLLYGATTTPNLAFEIGLTSKMSIELAGGYTPWEFGNLKTLKHYQIRSEWRWWFCETFNGSFVGVHLLGGEYNVGGIKLPLKIFPSLENYRYEGVFFGAGIGLGHQWMLSNRWSMEATLGAGYIRTTYDKYPCAACGKKIKTARKNYWGPTQAGVSFIYYLW